MISGDVKQRFYFLFIVFFITVIFAPIVSISQLYIPKNIENSLVTFEKTGVDSAGNIVYFPHGTGFIYYDISAEKTFIITNRHVLENRDSIMVRVNVLDTVSNEIIGGRWIIRLRVKDRNSWTVHPDSIIDLAIALAKIPASTYALDSGRLKSFDEVKLSDPVLFLGFPVLEAALGDVNYPIVRSGIVAFKSLNDIANPVTKKILVHKNHILLDAQIMNGNSGSPVLSTPKDGDDRVSLIGVISSHLFKLEKVKDPIGQKLKLRQEIDYNLGICIPADKIIELLKEYQSSQDTTKSEENGNTK